MPDQANAKSPDARLLESAEQGDFAGAVEALDAGANVNARGEFENTPLIFAAQNGHLQIVELLLRAKPEIAAKGYCDMTALHLAARDGRTEVVQRLLQTGAFDNERLINDVLTVASMSVQGKRAIVDMIQGHRLKMLAPKAEAGDSQAQLFAASESGDLAQAQAALEAGASVTAHDDRGMDALSWAALRGHTEIVKLLIARGAKVDARNSSDWPPLGQACGQGHLETARVLLKAGADVNISFDGGKTPLMCAAYQGNTELAKLLLEHGANKAARTSEDDDGRSMTARDLAAMQGKREVVALLDEFKKT